MFFQWFWQVESFLYSVDPLSTLNYAGIFQDFDHFSDLEGLSWHSKGCFDTQNSTVVNVEPKSATSVAAIQKNNIDGLGLPFAQTTWIA